MGSFDWLALFVCFCFFVFVGVFFSVCFLGGFFCCFYVCMLCVPANVLCFVCFVFLLLFLSFSCKDDVCSYTHYYV